MCSVPKQVKGGKESEASHEGDSHKSGKYMEVNRSKAMRMPCAVCPTNLKVEKNAKYHVI